MEDSLSSKPRSDDDIEDNAVFALTAEGEKQLKGSETALSRLELELLVLVDGRASVSQLLSRAKNSPAVAGIAALRSLLAKKMIETGRAAAPADHIDVGDFFKTGAFYVPPIAPTPDSVQEADDGAASLQLWGYFVRIARRAATERKPGPSGRLNAMIIEDEPHLAKLVATFLALDGFKTRIAGNRNEILEGLRRPPAPDLILLDVVLPDADGFDILGKLRYHPAFKNSAIIMLTAKATRESVIKGLSGGADGYVTKPFEMDVLIKAVHAVLGLGAKP